MDVQKMPEIDFGKEEEITLKTKKGSMKGLVHNGVAVFKGVPYAKPPIKELRFCPPEDNEPWDGIRDCTKFGHCAIQEESVLINTTPSEDCLYLNIWTPVERKEKLPVFFWIHGGGFFNGCGTMPYYDGTHFAMEDVIVVTINYRLGAIGFLALETSLKKYGTTGNWGTLDQIQALKWVNENIDDFGGDPSRITIAGESAGSFSISNLIMSPLTKGLFSQAVMESGSILENKIAVPFTEAKLEKCIDMSRRFAAVFGADDSEEGLEILRKIDALTLWQMGFFSSDATVTAPFAFWAAQDGYVIPKDPLDALSKGENNKGKFIIGYNHDEGAVFISGEVSKQVYDKYLYQTFKGRKAEEVRERYKDKFDNNYSQKVVDIVTYSYFKAGMTLFQEKLSEQGNDVYAYEFDYLPKGNYPLSMAGAHHAVEIPFVFDTNEEVGIKYDEAGKRITKQVHDLWLNFIKNSNPNEGISINANMKWDKYNVSDKKIYYLEPEIKCESTRDIDEIEFFKNVIYK